MQPEVNQITISALAGGIVTLILGIIAIVGARQVSTIVWAVVLLIIGIIAGGIGGILVFLGALLGLISTLTKTGGK